MLYNFENPADFNEKQSSSYNGSDNIHKIIQQVTANTRRTFRKYLNIQRANKRHNRTGKQSDKILNVRRISEINSLSVIIDCLECHHR